MVLGGALLASLSSVHAADDDAGQSRQSMANDQSATQWTYLIGHQWMNYHSDELPPGVNRPAGVARHWQGRIVMPIPENDWLPFAVLPRLTVRYATARDGTSGLGAADFFVLGVIGDWGSGRWGLGPLITSPASDERLGLTEWTFGVSAGFSQRFVEDRLNIFVVAGQTWGRLDPFRPEAEDVEAPFVINPMIIWQMTDEWYLANADMVIRYDWDTNAWNVPLGLRLGRLFVQDKGTWNVYLEYQTSAVWDDWPGSAISSQWRLNVGYSVPVR